MDLAIGAKQTWVMMDLLTKQGSSKVVQQCTYPLTGVGCVKRIYTDLCTLACTPTGLQLIDLDGSQYEGPFIVTEWSDDRPHADAATWSTAAKSNGAVTFTPA